MGVVVDLGSMLHLSCGMIISLLSLWSVSNNMIRISMLQAWVDYMPDSFSETLKPLLHCSRDAPNEDRVSGHFNPYEVVSIVIIFDIAYLSIFHLPFVLLHLCKSITSPVKRVLYCHTPLLGAKAAILESVAGRALYNR